jgi:deoxycytidine triphosphate deaminase
MLVEEQIRKMDIVTPSESLQLKNSTCDLTIGKIIPMGQEIDTWHSGSGSFWLEPSHMVSIVTKQCLNMPDDVTGLATLVTTLTKEGILCLNVGVVDPGYSGPLGATLVNFSDKPRKIQAGDRLFRVLFFDHAPIKNLSPYTVHPVSYAADISATSKNEFAETFLNVKRLMKIAEGRALETAFRYISRNLLPWIAIGASLFAVFWKD